MKTFPHMREVRVIGAPASAKDAKGGERQNQGSRSGSFTL